MSPLKNIFSHAKNRVGTPLQSLLMETKKGNAIENHIPAAGTVNQPFLAQLIAKKHPDWRVRCRADHDYNCAGLVWASRRTAITTWSAIHQILTDDGYRKTVDNSDLYEDDIVVYMDASTDEPDFLHVARVIRIYNLMGTTHSTSQASRHPIVLSKFGIQVGEIFHGLYNVPFERQSYILQFWTDRF